MAKHHMDKKYWIDLLAKQLASTCEHEFDLLDKELILFQVGEGLEAIINAKIEKLGNDSHTLTVYISLLSEEIKSKMPELHKKPRDVFKYSLNGNKKIGDRAFFFFIIPMTHDIKSFSDGQEASLQYTIDWLDEFLSDIKNISKDARSISQFIDERELVYSLPSALLFVSLLNVVNEPKILSEWIGRTPWKGSPYFMKYLDRIR